MRKYDTLEHRETAPFFLAIIAQVKSLSPERTATPNFYKYIFPPEVNYTQKDKRFSSNEAALMMLWRWNFCCMGALNLTVGHHFL
jgi:hypothetical protein